MMLEEKIAQMLLLGFEGQHLDEASVIAKDLREHALGGVVLFNHHCQDPQLEKNIKDPSQVANLTKHLKIIAKERSQLPLFVAIDYEGGRVNRLCETRGFPKTQTAKQIGHLHKDHIVIEAKQMANTLKDHGFNFNFAPVVDLQTNPHNEVIAKLERAFCHQPQRVGDIAHDFREHLIQEKIISTYKHFPGHGSSSDDSHRGAVDITSSWQSHELHPYKQLANNPHELDAIMIGHLTHHKLDNSGLPATLSQQMIQGLLRKEIGFDGLVVSDDMQMDAITNCFSLRESTILALNAGVDLLIFGNQLVKDPIRAGELVHLISEAVKNGDINPSRIDEAFLRIQRAKQYLNQK